MNLLLALRICGPIDLVSFAARLGLSEVELDARLWKLESQGLANHPTWTTGTWSVTEKGRAEVDRHEVAEVSAVRRDEARACVGTSK